MVPCEGIAGGSCEWAITSHDSKLQQEQHGFSSGILYELVRETELKIIH